MCILLQQVYTYTHESKYSYMLTKVSRSTPLSSHNKPLNKFISLE